MALTKHYSIIEIKGLTYFLMNTPDHHTVIGLKNLMKIIKNNKVVRPLIVREQIVY